ncbi:Zinc carboxypeptidase [Jatrophihabitans endophyticus]|uniref:Zinc carboxypeptidase n=1 Tax=Jatrophihabitans endophyticus TaxID=1206085 RepID=A0A1M5EKE3_9ACTN|nr:M14 family zinc carboxypeptidase [Jatrophihabitans endophyticus]SHF79738.1 Zinc carboxypeptidase [Jatrophihabitans endophyticus]
MNRADTDPALPLDRILALVDEVPQIERFPSVDELVAAFDDLAAGAPALVRRRRIGSSRLGEAIHCLTIGDGDDHAVIVGGVHPNEPIGGPTALHLARVLVEDAELRTSLGYTWHIIGCVDPDGMRLNEGWFCGTLDRAEYGRRFYRPASDEQVEWTFPLEYKELYFDRVIPETLALMRLIDDVRPTFLCSLHNGELGGVYYYLNTEAAELYPQLHAVPAHLGVPLDSGEPEVPYVPRYATAVFGETGVEAHYEFVSSLGMDPTRGLASGTSSAAYAARYNTLSLVSELPYWSHPDAADERPSATSYPDVLRGRADGLTELGYTVLSVLEATAGERTLDSPFLRALRQFAPHFVLDGEQEGRRAELAENDRPATVAEVFTGGDLVHGFRMRYGGMTLRLLEAEIGAGNGTPAIREQYRRMTRVYQEWAEAALAVTPAETLPIRSLVGVQFGAIVAAAGYARGRHGPGR